MDILRTFHLHMISDSTGETLITIAKAVRVQYAQVRAVEHLQAALRRQHELGDHWRSASLLVELASCRRLRGEAAEAARLLEAAEALLDKIGGHLPTADQPGRDETAAWVAEHLTAEERAIP